MENMNKKPVDEDKVNNRMADLLKQSLDSYDSSGKDVSEINHNNPNGKKDTPCLVSTDLMNFTKILEAMDVISESLDAIDPGEEQIEGTVSYDKDAVLEELNRIFTPVLITQSIEKEIADKEHMELNEAAVLTERSIIKFDDEARMSQLIAVCAKLIAKAKNTNDWQMFVKASELKKKSALDIQKNEFEAAKALAQQYLVKVSTTNNSSVARDAANDLLPQTQH